jgi:hypothetical protein
MRSVAAAAAVRCLREATGIQLPAVDRRVVEAALFRLI